MNSFDGSMAAVARLPVPEAAEQVGERFEQRGQVEHGQVRQSRQGGTSGTWGRAGGFRLAKTSPTGRSRIGPSGVAAIMSLTDTSRPIGSRRPWRRTPN